jgi:hypothetical protein
MSFEIVHLPESLENISGIAHGARPQINILKYIFFPFKFYIMFNDMTNESILNIYIHLFTIYI